MTSEPVRRARDTDSELRQPFPIGDGTYGQYVQNIKPLTIRPLDIEWSNQESLTISTTTLPLSFGDNGYDIAMVRVETAGIRFTLNDSVPTAAIGWPLDAGDSIILTGVSEVRDSRFIRRDGVDASLTVFYGRRILVSGVV